MAKVHGEADDGMGSAQNQGSRQRSKLEGGLEGAPEGCEKRKS